MAPNRLTVVNFPFGIVGSTLGLALTAEQSGVP
jgi:hypothetical protein